MRYKFCCKSDADSECLKFFKLVVFCSNSHIVKKSLTAVTEHLYLTSLKEACVYNFILYVQTVQQIYVQVFMQPIFCRLCIAYMDKILVSIFNSNFKFVNSI